MTAKHHCDSVTVITRISVYIPSVVFGTVSTISIVKIHNSSCCGSCETGGEQAVGGVAIQRYCSIWLEEVVLFFVV